MRRIILIAGLCTLPLLTGCNHFFGLFHNKTNDVDPALQNRYPPTADELVHYLNENSKLVQSMRCTGMSLKAEKDLGVFQNITLEANMCAQQPRNFRLQATAPYSGGTAVDLGSNPQEFWFWIKDMSPGNQVSPLFHCSYDVLEQGTAKIMPLPFQPEWILEAMGMSDYGPSTRYQLKVEAKTLKLIERTKSPQGKPMLKVIVFNRYPVKVPTPQIMEYILVDEATKKEICSARISESQVIQTGGPTGALVPKTLTIHWREENMRLTMKLINPQIGVPFEPGAPTFVRSAVPGMPSIDMASGLMDHNPSSIQKVKGYGQLP